MIPYDLTDKEIDALVIEQAADDGNWTAEYLNVRTKRGSRERFL